MFVLFNYMRTGRFFKKKTKDIYFTLPLLMHNCDIVWAHKFICKNSISEYYSFRNSISIYFSLLTSIYNFCKSKVALWVKKIQSLIFTYRFMGRLTFLVNLAGFGILRETHLWGCLLGHFQAGLTWGGERKRGTIGICTAPPAHGLGSWTE